MSIQALAEIASYKKTMTQIIREDQGTLILIFEKCILNSADWASSLIDFEQMKKNDITNFTGLTSQSLVSVEDSKSNIQIMDETPAELNENQNESKFSYSIEDSEVEIPEFMKNDLDQLRAINNFKRNP